MYEALYDEGEREMREDLARSIRDLRDFQADHVGIAERYSGRLLAEYATLTRRVADDAQALCGYLRYFGKL